MKPAGGWPLTLTFCHITAAEVFRYYQDRSLSTVNTANTICSVWTSTACRAAANNGGQCAAVERLTAGGSCRLRGRSLPLTEMKKGRKRENSWEMKGLAAVYLCTVILWWLIHYKHCLWLWSEDMNKTRGLCSCQEYSCLLESKTCDLVSKQMKGGQS